MAGKRKKPQSIFAYLMKNLAIGLLAILAGGLLVFVCIITDFFGLLSVPAYYRGPDLSQIEKEIKASAEEDYGDIDTSDLGDKGYFEILDSSGKVLYSGKPGGKTYYPPYQIKYIPETDHSIYIELSKFVDNKEPLYLLSIQNFDNNDETKEDNLVQIFKEDGSIVFSSDNGDDKKISSEELAYIKKNSDRQFGRYYGKTMAREKKVFCSPDGDGLRIAIFHFESPYVQYKKAQNRLYYTRDLLLVLYLAYIIAVTLITSFLFYRKLKSPLLSLKTAMEEATTGKKVEVDSKVETREISQVLEAFNTMEDRLEKMDAEREKAREERNTALSDISHDLKTPITVISGYADALRDGIIPMEESYKYLDIISQKANTMSELVTQFSDYSRFENPKFRISLERGDLAEYLRAYMANRFNELTLQGYQVETDLPEQEVYFDFDQSQMKRVFENIISNSLKYTESGTTIYAAMKCDEKRIEIILGDNGPGVPEDLQKKLFEPFAVGDKSRKSGKGTGLGLSIAKKIVEAHGGKIMAMSSYEGQDGLYFQIVFHRRLSLTEVDNGRKNR